MTNERDNENFCQELLVGHTSIPHSAGKKERTVIINRVFLVLEICHNKFFFKKKKFYRGFVMKPDAEGSDG